MILHLALHLFEIGALSHQFVCELLIHSGSDAVPCAPTLFPPLLQKCDVHNEEEGHKEARNQYKRETLHQTSVVKRAEQDCIQKIGDAEQVPKEKRGAEAELIICHHPSSNPRGRYRHDDVSESSGPSKPSRQHSFDIGHEESSPMNRH